MASPCLPRWISSLATRAIHTSARWIRPLTLGVRAMIIDEAGRVCLVRHSYVAGWHFPGGAVEAGETIRAALQREVVEEVRIEITGEPSLHGIFFNRSASRRDHILLYVVRDFRVAGPVRPNLEIRDCGFFAPDALPQGTTGATRRRLNELLGSGPPADEW